MKVWPLPTFFRWRASHEAKFLMRQSAESAECSSEQLAHLKGWVQMVFPFLRSSWSMSEVEHFRHSLWCSSSVWSPPQVRHRTGQSGWTLSPYFQQRVHWVIPIFSVQLLRMQGTSKKMSCHFVSSFTLLSSWSGMVKETLARGDSPGPSRLVQSGPSMKTAFVRSG